MKLSKRNIRHQIFFFSMFIIISWLLTASNTIEHVYAQFDFDAFLGNPISDEDIDGIIGSEWDDAGKYPGVTIDPQGIAEILIKNDGTYLYLAMQFTADSPNPWVGFQFNFDTHMSSGADGALFGHDGIGANQYRDISFGGLGSISADVIQDGVGAINVETSNLVTVELKKPLSSGDSVGADIDWSGSNTYILIIRWDSNGVGSSGGNSNHWSTSVRDRTVYINVNAIPEFSGLELVFSLAAITVLVIVLKRKTN